MLVDDDAGAFFPHPMMIRAAGQSGLQVHFPQQGWVARVGAQWIVGGIDVEMEHYAVALVDRLLKPVEASVDLAEAKVYQPKTSQGLRP